MRRQITEYLEIDLDTEQWHCVTCAHPLGSARENYKQGCLVLGARPQRGAPPDRRR